MKFKTSLFASAVYVLILTGCASHSEMSETERALNEKIASATDSIQAAQLQLFEAGVLNEVPGKEPIDLSDEGKLITVSWQGDAEQLLEKIAKDSSRKFETIGVKVPLPIDVNIEDEPLNHVISKVQAQVGYRALVSYTPDTITLHFKKLQDGV